MMDHIKHTAQSIQETLDDTGSYLQAKINSVLQKFKVTAEIDNLPSVHLDQEMIVPIQQSLKVPVKAAVQIQTTLRPTILFPLDLVLSSDDVSFKGMDISVDQQVMIDDEIEVDVNQLFDALIDLDEAWVSRIKKSLPLKKTAKLKLKQPVRIKGNLTPEVESLSLRIKKEISLDVEVPINHMVEIQGTADVTLATEIKTPIKAELPVRLGGPLQVKILSLSLHNNPR